MIFKRIHQFILPPAMCKSEKKNMVDILYTKIFTDFISNK